MAANSYSFSKRERERKKMKKKQEKLARRHGTTEEDSGQDPSEQASAPGEEEGNR